MNFPTAWRTSPFVRVDFDDILTHIDQNTSKISIPSNHYIPTLESIQHFDQTSNSTKYISLNNTSIPVYYYEIEILSSVESDRVADGVSIGLVPRLAFPEGTSAQLGTLPGLLPGSIGFSSSGSIFHNGRELVTTSYCFGTHDIVGCGLELTGKKRIFFTCNSKIIECPLIDFNNGNEYSFLPVVGLEGMGTTIRANFGSIPFQCNLNKMTVVNIHYTFDENENENDELSSNNRYNIHNNDNDDDNEGDDDGDIALSIASAMSMREAEAVEAWMDGDTERTLECICLLTDIIANHEEVVVVSRNKNKSNSKTISTATTSTTSDDTGSGKFDEISYEYI
eukprot:gene471-880_t